MWIAGVAAIVGLVVVGVACFIYIIALANGMSR